MDKFKQLIKSTGIYFLGNVLAKVISFFMLPIYTRFIAAEGLGYYDLAYSYLNIIVPLVCLTIWAGALRFVIDYPNEEDKKKVIFNAGIVLVIGIVLFISGGIIFNQFAEIQYLPHILVIGVATMLHNYYSNVARALGYDSIFALSGIIGSFVNCFTNICLILGAKMGEESLFISLAVGLLTQVVIMENRIKVRHIVLAKHTVGQFDKEIILKLLKYSAPLAFNSVCFWFLSSYNRIGVSNELGLEANGIFSVAGKYAYAIGLVSNAFSYAIQELLYRTESNSEDTHGTYSLISDNYIKMLMLGLALLLPVIQVTFPWLIGEGYNAAFVLVPLNLLGTVFSIYGLYLGDIFAAEKQTKHVITTTIPAALVNIVLFHFLVPVLGVQAANISLILGFLTLIVNRLVFLQKVTTIKVDLKMLFVLFLVFGFSWFIYLMNNAILSLVAFVICFAITLYAFRDLLKRLIKR